jgi:DNA invertase Pin-like site-specific DNA recombinase
LPERSETGVTGSHDPGSLDTSKLAIVYLRQSSPGQVRDHVVATQEQYRLREIPERLGFPQERVIIVDEDLGVSGQTIAGRKGMLRVLDLLERGTVACVVVRDVSRLSRDEFTADIGLIARQCYQSGARIITAEKIYDPADSSDQLLLGLQGIIAGWDRGNIVRRLAHHRRAKQARGVNINGAVPPGYEKLTDVPRGSPDHGRLRISRDREVRDRIAQILRKGLELRGVLAVVRYLRTHSLSVPLLRGETLSPVTGTDGVTRPTGKGLRVIQWAEATRYNVTRILKNPTYAGAIVNGRRVRIVDRARGSYRWSTRRSYPECTVIRDAHEAYITWEEHLELVQAIARNNQLKVFGKGEALLSGLRLLRCGGCGSAMVVAYNNPVRRSRGRIYRNTPYTYVCARRSADGRNSSCQNPSGPHIDRAAREILLFALGELNLDGLREALENQGRRAGEARRIQLQQVETLDRRARMLEEAIAEARSAEARRRLIAKLEEVLDGLGRAQEQLTQPVEPEKPLLTPDVLRRLEFLKDPTNAWERFSQRTRKEIVQALADSVWIYPDRDGYILAFEWRGGGRAAAKVQTVTRRRVRPIPEEISSLFSDEFDMGRFRSLACRSGRAPRGGPGSPRRDAAHCPRR